MSSGDASSKASAAGPVISAKEMKELKRVYQKMCYYAEKVHKIERLRSVTDRLAKLRRPERTRHRGGGGGRGNRGAGAGMAYQFRHSDGAVVVGGAGGDSGDDDSLLEPAVRREVASLYTERKELESSLKEIRSRPEQHIRPQDTATALRELGRRVTKREVNDMMWEVDEKLDGVVDWEEFLLMFERNIRDTSGLEPASFYHMVQFMIYDRDDNGMVSIDETMNMLYARLGREKMETTITKLFGGDDGAPIKEVGQQGGEINFVRYWDVVEKEQTKMFSESELGRNLAEKKRKKKADFVKNK